MTKEYKKEDIDLEASLLNALAIKKNFDQFIQNIDHKRLIPIMSNLLKDFGKYYEKYNSDLDWQVFYPEFCEWHRRDLDEQDLAYYRETVFPLIQNSSKDDVYVSLLEREARIKIEDVLSKGFDDVSIVETIKELNNKKSIYKKEIDEDVFKLSSVDCRILDASNGISWCLPALQSGLNSHMPGQFVVVAADSDTGKSAFCITQAVHTFKQIQESNKPILYCTSEDTKEDLVCRFLSNLYKDRVLGGFEEVITKYDKVLEHYKKNFNDELFVGMSIRSPNDLYKIQTKIEKYEPALIIIDILDKLSNSDHIIDLTKLYQEIRGIANDGFRVIGTSQAGNTAYQDSETKEYKHRKWLTEKDLAGSKGGGKQGAAYCMIMIGKDDEMPNIRYLSTTKKKRGRHVAITCELEDIYSNYKELI